MHAVHQSTNSVCLFLIPCLYVTLIFGHNKTFTTYHHPLLEYCSYYADFDLLNSDSFFYLPTVVPDIERNAGGFQHGLHDDGHPRAWQPLHQHLSDDAFRCPASVRSRRIPSQEYLNYFSPLMILRV